MYRALHVHRWGRKRHLLSLLEFDMSTATFAILQDDVSVPLFISPLFNSLAKWLQCAEQKKSFSGLRIVLSSCVGSEDWRTQGELQQGTLLNDCLSAQQEGPGLLSMSMDELWTSQLLHSQGSFCISQGFYARLCAPVSFHLPRFCQRKSKGLYWTLR